jgi:hypothetical protein
MMAVATATLLAAATPARSQALPPADLPASAYGLGATFQSGGMQTQLPPVAPVSGSTTPYSNTAKVATFSDSLPIVPDVLPMPALTVTAEGLISHVASNGIQIDSASSGASAKLRSLDLSLLDEYPPSATPGVSSEPFLPGPFLVVKARDVEAAASFSEVFPNNTTLLGTSSIGELTIAGNLVDNKKLSFSGKLTSPRVLFQNDHITITLDQQVRAGVISCEPACHFLPADLATTAIDIALNNADLNGQKVSGEIVVGRAQVGGIGGAVAIVLSNQPPQ